MSNLKRKIENITIDKKDYIMAFDMNSCEVFKELSGQSILNSLLKLNELEDMTVLYFIASTLRDKETEKILGNKLFNGDFDLFSLVITLLPTVINIVTSGFPQAEENEKN
ncbi:hypothetical protein [Clostridium uliginosum]|uniref:Uncharacterized protein n=1 Tax=Clostridium uliginosum TaxID=119641 RepID=A0A1I1GTS5_9CLOT|nr:hypothetical protein [Clostridium uliginosum]SFC15187.1 hypothetical protein SAMN05421842_10165 [Clostridium uliginosum]